MRRITAYTLLLTLLCFPVNPLHAQTAPEPTEPSPASANVYTYTTTAHRLDGNRLIDGAGVFPAVQSFDVLLGESAAWLVGATVGAEPVWISVSAQGTIRGVYPGMEGTYTASQVFSDQLPAGMPPVMVHDTLGSFIDLQFPINIMPLTHATRAIERVVYPNQDGQLALLDGNYVPLIVHDLDLAPDVRVVLNDLGQAAVYANADDQRYPHGILGDALENTALVVMDMGFGEITAQIDLPDNQVFEGISPMWADVDSDGSPDLVTTVSDADNGAQVRVYRADGTLLAQGPPIGLGGRWRHQLAFAPFGANGEMLLAEVLTPHIGGIVGFFRYDGAGTLERVARFDGFTSHVINTRNLDMAVAGDFDGDGQPELVLPSQDLRWIAGLALDASNQVVERWILPLDGVLASNLSAVTLPDGGLALAAGIVNDDGTAKARIWTP